jgi:hypothetical protein
MNDAYQIATQHATELTARGFAQGAQRTADELYRLYTGGDSQRMNEARFQWDMYTGNQLRHLARLPGESEFDFLRRPHKQFLNLTRVVIDVLSQLYKRPVERVCHATPALGARLERVHRANAMDRLLATVDRLTRLQGVAAVLVSHEDGEVRYWPWPAHRLLFVPDPARPDRPLAVVALAAGDGKLAHVWSHDRAATVRDGKIVRDASHDYGRVPIAFVHDRLPVDGFWVEGRGRALAWANNEFNAKLSELSHTVAMQGFGVMEIVNPDPAQEIAIGPAHALRFHVSANEPYGVNFKSPGAPIRELIEDLEFMLRVLLKSQRVPDSVLSVQPLSNQSGLSILAQQTPVLEDRVERRQVFAAFESELFDTTLAVLRAHESLTERGKLHVDYPEPELEQSAAERLKVDDWRLRHGLVTPWELMARDDPDRFTDIEQARETWLNNRRALAEHNTQTETDDE